MLAISNVSVSYQTEKVAPVPVLNNLSLQVPPGKYYSIVGPSGCGKSTLLLCAAGLVQPTSGTVTLDGTAPSSLRARHRIGWVPQNPVFLAWRTVQGNIQLCNESAQYPVNHRVSEYLTNFRLERFACAYPHELSGGMLSRVALARALVHSPRYLFLDEAFNDLDEVLRERINGDIQRLWQQSGITVVAVTHSISEAIANSDAVVVMSPRPASVLHVFAVPFPRPRRRDSAVEPHLVQLEREIRDVLHRAYESGNE